MVYLIMGRTGAGKDYLASKLRDAGLKTVKSYTTRPRRSLDEDTHIFITKDEAKTYTDRVAETVINGYEYFATREQVKQSDIYIIDPIGVETLVKTMPETTFHVIYVIADDMERRIHAVSRATDKIAEEQVFDKRNESENEQFTAFEDKLLAMQENNGLLAPNITAVDIYDNDYEKSDIDKFIKEIMQRKLLHDRLTNIIKESITLNILPKFDDNSIQQIDSDGSFNGITFEHYADIVMNNPKHMHSLMCAFITESPLFAPYTKTL